MSRSGRPAKRVLWADLGEYEGRIDGDSHGLREIIASHARLGGPDEEPDKDYHIVGDSTDEH